MKISFKASALAVSIALLGAISAPAQAVPITGTLSIGGGNASPAGGNVASWSTLTTGTWTGITFQNPGGITNVTPVLSSEGFTAFSTPVTLSNVTFSTPGQLFTATGGGGEVMTYTWSTVSLSGGSNSFTANFVGTMTLTNASTTYTTTDYAAGWSCNNCSSGGGWSINLNPIPVPGSLALLGVGLLGAAGVARRSVRAAA